MSKIALSQRGFFAPAALALLLLLVFTALTHVGMAIYLHTGAFTTVRPLGGIALGLCLVLGPRFLPSVLLAAAAGSLATKFVEGDRLVDALVSTGATLGAVTAIFALRRSIFRVNFRDWRHLFGFMALAAVAAGISGLAYETVMDMSGAPSSWTDRLQWTITTACSFCVFTPTTVLLASFTWARLREHGWRLAVAMAALALVLCVICFLPLPVPTLFVVPLTLAVVVILAEVEGAAAGLLLVEIMFTATITLRPGLAAFSPAYPLGWQLFVSQGVIVIMTMVILPLAAAVNERQALRADLRLAAAEARDSAALLHGIIDSAHDHAIYMLDPEGNVVTWNNGAERNKGFTAKEVIGTNYARFFPPEAVEACLPERTLEAARINGSLRDEGWRLRKNGTRFWADISLTAIREPDGTLRGFAKVTRDISERKLHVDGLALAKEAAEKASEVKSEFLANMSHEIRTPLTSVMGFADLIQEQPGLSDQVRGYTGQVRNGARLLMSLIADILDYSKLESGQMTLLPVPTRVGDVLRETVELLAVQAAAKGLSLELAPSPAFDLTVMVDHGRLRQILLNLAGNAIKFTDRGAVTLGAVQFENGTIRFSVQDTGIGISPAQLGHLFERFTQLDSGPARRHGGTGLGLAICKSLAEAMGGVIAVNSRVGHGSTFWFEIPALQVTNDTGQGQMLEAPEAPTRFRQVLVVNDQAANRLLIRAALEPIGIEITEAGSGEEALLLARQGEFDLILLDVRMPGMGEEAAMRALRAGHHARTPIVAFTAESDMARRGELTAAGFDAVCAKPLQIQACAASWRNGT